MLMMSHLIRIYAVCKFSCFRLGYLSRKRIPNVDLVETAHLEQDYLNLHILFAKVLVGIKKKGTVVSFLMLSWRPFVPAITDLMIDCK